MTPIEKTIRCLGVRGFHEMAYVRWDQGQGGRPTLCVHGLTRNGRDFDPLAARLAETGPVLAPDIPGRGRSPWLASAADYGYPLYCNDVATLIASLDVPEIDYVGTSMGGIIGMMLASLPGSPIRRLVLNDIGALVPKAALERIGSYVGKDEAYSDLADFDAAFRQTYAPFGNLTDAQWRHLVAYGHRVLPDGRIAAAYDPAIGDAFRVSMEDISLWAYYDRITCPTLLVHGAASDLLSAELAQEMTQRGPKTQLYTVGDAGHAPALMAADQIDAIRDFLA